MFHWPGISWNKGISLPNSYLLGFLVAWRCYHLTGIMSCVLLFHSFIYGCFLQWWYPQNTPKWSFLVGKPTVVGYHHFRKHPSESLPLKCSTCHSIKSIKASRLQSLPKNTQFLPIFLQQNDDILTKPIFLNFFHRSKKDKKTLQNDHHHPKESFCHQNSP